MKELVFQRSKDRWQMNLSKDEEIKIRNQNVYVNQNSDFCQ